MSDFIAHVQTAIEQHRLFRRREKILLAVSGGMDSMVLFELMRALAKEQGWQLTVAHLNHGLRGRSSDADERLAQREAKRKGLPFVSERAEVRNMAREKGISIEMAARQARHQFLARVARKTGCRRIALAHHADDQVELFFVRLLRGAGMEGLAGMHWRNPSPADPKVMLVRPLLSVTRKEIERFAKVENLRYRHDATNDSLDILRNRIRHELLPLLEKNYQPAVRRVVVRLMDLLSAESELTRTFIDDLLTDSPEQFDKLPVAIQRRLLQLQLIRLGVRHDYATVEQLRQKSGRFVTLSPELTLFRDDAGEVRQRDLEKSEFNTQRKVVDLKGRGLVRFNGVAFDWQIENSRGSKASKMAGREVFDADRVGQRIILRHWQPGDRYRPIGMAKAVKMQDVFVNAKVPRARRHQLVVATTEEGEVFWVEDMRISERFKLDAATRRRLEWSWRRA